jgi:thiol-disulfide isomerase/thioredoxin
MVLKTSDSMIGKTARYIGNMEEGEVCLVMIICNHCPYVLFRMPQISQLVKDYKDSVRIVAVNSNDASPTTEDSHPEDAPEFMPEFIEEWDLQCDYIFDEDQSIAKDYGAVCTPEFYVVDREGIIVYHGELDPSHISNRLMPTGSSLRHAIDLALVNKTIDWDPNPSFGCSVKWKN